MSHIFKRLLTLSAPALILGTVLAGCAETPQSPQIELNQKFNTIGGEYIVSHFPGIPSINGAPAVEADPWGPTQFQQIQYLDHQCHIQLDRYIPSVMSDIGNLAVPMGAATGAATAAGSALAVVGKVTGVGFWQYMKEVGYSAAGSGFGSGLVSAIDRHKLAVRYVQYACMVGFVGRAAAKAHILRGVEINPWAGTSDAIRQHMPTGSEVVQPDIVQSDDGSLKATMSAGDTNNNKPAEDDSNNQPAIPVMP